MGLLERALQYKQRINESGKETLIDRIKGPAETDYVSVLDGKKVNISEIDDFSDETINTNVELENDKESTEIVTEEEIDKTDSEEIIERSDNEIVSPDIFEADSSDVKNDTIISDPRLDSELAEQISNQDESVKSTNEATEAVDAVSDIKNITKEESDKESILNGYEMPEFNDYGTLFEIQSEFIKADSIEEIYSTILFSIMGQLGVSSVSIVTPLSDDEKKWKITDSHGIKISDNEVFWSITDGILHLLSTYKGVLDIEELKHDPDLRDDYYKFVSVDARILTPLLRDGFLVGAILVGEKISSEDFNAEEIEFLQTLSDMASSMINSLSKTEKISTEIIGLRIEKEILADVEFFQDSLLKVNSLDELREVIQKNFYSLGLESYCLFMTDHSGGDFYPRYFENEDQLGFSNSGFKIKRDNRLVTFLVNKKSSIILENFHESSVIIDTFGKNRLSKMEIFIAYPFIISGQLSGFITIFKINTAVDLVDIDIRIQKINRFIFPYLKSVDEVDSGMDRYNDLMEMFYQKIEKEIRHADDLNIPLSLVLFTFKNHKRFYERFGKIEFEKFSGKVSDILKKRLTTGDFSARIDRNKFIAVLPGKEKRYSVMFANTVKNEIIENCEMSDFKLLITSLNSVFPDDGKDLFSLLEVLE